MTCNAKINGTWKDISNSFVKVNGTWRSVNKTYIKVNGVWRDTCKNNSKGLFGVRINVNDSNPESAVTYIDDSVGFTPARGNNGAFSHGSWADKFPFNEIKPCVLKNGVVQYYLNPNDYTKKQDGSNADITSGNDGDVMIEFPKVYWNIESVGNYINVRYSDVKVDNSFECLAHHNGVTEKDKIYISAYDGYEMNSKLRSLSGKTPSSTKTISNFRNLAQSNGSNYNQMTYYSLLMLQVLYVVMFKSLDSQSALGYGLTNSSLTNTGGADKKGMFYGESLAKQQMKFCGIEDFYGNISYFIDGLYLNSSNEILIGNNNFNDNGNGYTNFGLMATGTLTNYITKVQGGTSTGFIPKVAFGNTYTYYCDITRTDSSSLAYFSGNWVSYLQTGSFNLMINAKPNSSGTHLGARLIYI